MQSSPFVGGRGIRVTIAFFSVSEPAL